ncbi:hypothetical protein PHLCEN_2v3802 [Hermanssonia centrifuga]|uniref:Uncharacterized protein n=1 Tax=Hermanssonia centrifuga TaxID=98765 RepID=A0A2R6QBM7_9APHY|nr:hypothetical protein PHLCEN_2v3802 [Hermanssonia centrifuga]
MSSVTFDNFQNGQASGLTVSFPPPILEANSEVTSSMQVVVSFAILSLAAVDFVWLRVLWVALNRNMQKVAREKAIFTSQLGAYVVCLLLSNLLSSVSFIMNITWIVEGGVLTGEQTFGSF